MVCDHMCADPGLEDTPRRELKFHSAGTLSKIVWTNMGEEGRTACALYGSGRYQPVFFVFPSL